MSGFQREDFQRPRKKNNLEQLLLGVEEEERDGNFDGDASKKLDEVQSIPDISELRLSRRDSISSQLQQDRVLRLYRAYIRFNSFRGQSMETIPVADLDLVCFPPEDELRQGESGFEAKWATLLTRLTKFLASVARSAIPRARGEKSITFSTLRGYVRMLQFWVDRKYLERKCDPPVKYGLNKAMADIARGIAQKLPGTNLNFKPRTKHGNGLLGPEELALLLDYDQHMTQCIELAECHHLAWVLAQAAAIRPASLAVARNPTPREGGGLPCLTWGDIQMQRSGGDTSRIFVLITFRTLKSNRTDSDRAEHNQVLMLRFESSRRPSTLDLSVPHRILTIALRRGAVKGIPSPNTHEELLESVNTVLDSDLLHITFKEEFLNRPVLLKSGPRGRRLFDEPMRSEALSEYLKRVGIAVSLRDNLTFYALRHAAAPVLIARLGEKGARAIMGHGLSSAALELFYAAKYLTTRTDMTAIGQGEDGADQVTPEIGAARGGLTREQLTMMGPWINDWVEIQRQAASDYQELDAAGRKQRDKWWRQVAVKAFREEKTEERRDSMRVDGDHTTERIDSLVARNTAMNDYMLRQIRKEKERASSTIAEDSATISELDALGVCLDDELPEPEFFRQPAADAEEQYQDAVGAPGSARIIDISPLELSINSSIDSIDIRRQVDSLEFKVAAKTIMKTWLSIGSEGSEMGKKKHHEKKKIACNLCEEDPTISEVFWDLPSKMARHRNGAKHYPWTRFMREAEAHQAAFGLAGLECRFCAAVAPGNARLPVSRHRHDLNVHIKGSSSTVLAAKYPTHEWWNHCGLNEQELGDIVARHDALKRQAGWYDVDFNGNPDVKMERVRSTRNRRNRRMSALMDVRYSNNAELPRSIAFEGRFSGSLVRGGPPCDLFSWGSTTGLIQIMDLDGRRPPELALHAPGLTLGLVLTEPPTNGTLPDWMEPEQ